MPARQLSATVWMVGSGTDELALTHPSDCHCYLVWDGTGGMLIDAGTGLGAERWVENIREICDLSRIHGVVLTHYHADHAGGAAAARRAGLRVVASAPTAAALAVADEERTSLALARDAGIYPHDYQLTPAVVDDVADDGTEVYASERLRMSVLDAPGHSDGHIVVVLTDGQLARGWMFSGDCLFAGGTISLQALHDCRPRLYGDTVIRLADVRPEALLPGHGDVVLESAWRDVAAAAESFRRLVPPPNFLTSA